MNLIHVFQYSPKKGQPKRVYEDRPWRFSINGIVHQTLMFVVDPQDPSGYRNEIGPAEYASLAEAKIAADLEETKMKAEALQRQLACEAIKRLKEGVDKFTFY